MSIIIIDRTFDLGVVIVSKELILRLIPKLNGVELDEVVASIEMTKFKSDLISLRKEVRKPDIQTDTFSVLFVMGHTLLKMGLVKGFNAMYAVIVKKLFLTKLQHLRHTLRRVLRLGLNTLVA